MTLDLSRTRTAPVRLCFLGLFLSASLASAQATFTAVDTGENSFRWEEAGSWVEAAVPNAPGAEVTINKFTGLDRNVNLGDEGNANGFTVGKILSINDSDGRNRIRRGSVNFQATNGNAEIHVSGTGEGRLEFRMDESPNQVVHLASTLATWVEKENEESELRFRGNLSGPGGLILNGIGEVRFRPMDGAAFLAVGSANRHERPPTLHLYRVHGDQSGRAAPASVRSYQHGLYRGAPRRPIAA